MTLGTPALVDLNGDGRVNDYYVFNAEGSTPHTQFGVTLGADWNGFDLELFFQGATGARGAMPSRSAANKAICGITDNTRSRMHIHRATLM